MNRSTGRCGWARGTVWRGAGRPFRTVPMGVAQGIVGREGIASDASGRFYLATERGLAVGTRAGKSDSALPESPKPVQGAGDDAASVYVDATGVVWYRMREQSVPSRERQGVWRSARAGTAAGTLGRDSRGSGWQPVGAQREIACMFARHGAPFRSASGAYRNRPTRIRRWRLDPRDRLLVPTYRGLAAQTATRGWE